MSIEAVLSGAARWTVVQGDNLAIMQAMPPCSVHLAYLDAPFMTGRDFETADGQLAYSDKWPNLRTYIDSVLDRCAAARDTLTEDGCLWLHVDPETSHYLKVGLDLLFGRECFRNEIIWRYRRWPVEGSDFQRMHDVLLRYTKSPKRQRWNQLYEPLSPATIAIHGTKKQKHVQTEKGRSGVRMVAIPTKNHRGHTCPMYGRSALSPRSPRSAPDGPQRNRPRFWSASSPRARIPVM